MSFFADKLNLICQYTGYRGGTYIWFEPYGYIDGNGYVAAVGFMGMRVKRFEIGSGYNVLHRIPWLILKPYALVGIQNSKAVSGDYYATPVNGPNYVQNQPIWVERNDVTQLIGTVGISFGVRIKQRIGLYLGWQYAYAHHPYQRMYFDYKYKGTQQPLGIFEASGTGRLISIGVSYRFRNLIERQVRKK